MTTDGFYHWRDNWFFKRLADGSVRIWKLRAIGENIPDPNTLAAADIPPAEWASIIAAVSAAGETGETYHAAFALHEGRALSAGGTDRAGGDER